MIQVCIIDDREDVWNFAPNLIHVKPYHFFRHTGDINAPPGLTKQDQDDKSGFTFNKDGTAINKQPENSTAVESSDTVATNSAGEDFAENPNQECDDAQEVDKDDTSRNNSFLVRRVTSDLSLSDEEDSDDHSKASDGDAADGDKEESCDEKKDTGESKSVVELKSGGLPAPESKIDEVTAPEVIAKGEQSNISTDQPEKTELGEDNNPKCSNNKSSIDAELQEVKLDIVEEPTASSETTLPAEIAAAGPTGREEIEVEDQDDYLLYLEEILQSIHQAFYSLHSDKREENDVPDVKNVVPYVRRKVLKVFLFN